MIATETERSTKMTTNKKKSTSGEAPILRQDYGTTPEEKSQAARLFDMIGEGIGRAVSRPKDPAVDRRLRQLVSEANSTGDCIINMGFGYYRPGDDDCVEFQEYVAKERHRAKEILRKVNRMQQAYDRRYQ